MKLNYWEIMTIPSASKLYLEDSLGCIMPLSIDIGIVREEDEELDVFIWYRALTIMLRP
jgi:hypothetical protein